MSTHCHRCIVHPQHNKVGVCGLCVRERLVALLDEYSSSSAEGKRCTSPASGTASADGPYHSFSSSSARENHIQLSSPAGAARPVEPRNGSEQPIHLPPPATTSLLQKLKLKAFMSIPPSPERAVLNKSATGFPSPSPTVFHQKNKLSLPFKSRKSSVSEVTDMPLIQSKVSLEASNDQVSYPNSMLTVGQRKPSLITLFHQSEVAPDTANHAALRASEKENYAHTDERCHRIEQFSAAMQSPGFALPSTKAAVSGKYRQNYTVECLADDGTPAPADGSAEQLSNSTSSSWIGSLFQRKKHRATSKAKSKAPGSQATWVYESVELEEANSARNSLHYARVSEDSPSLKQVRRPRMQHGEATNFQTELRATQGWRAPGDPKDLESVTGCTLSTMGLSNKHYVDDDGVHVSDQESPHFPRSRSWGRAWSRSTPSSHFFTSSPHHQLLGSSTQHLNKKPSSELHPQHYHYLTSTPKHPALDTPAPKDSRLAVGFYFGAFRRSKRQQH